MPTSACNIGPLRIGDPGSPLLVIAGPCVLEEPGTNDQIATVLHDTCASLGLPLIFKASFDKANRTSLASPRGPGLQTGLKELARIGRTFGLPLTTDIHEAEQAARAAEVVDLLQIPAFLCRQTDLLLACAATGRAINLKKGQFLSPQEMLPAISKLREGGAPDIMLTERGTFFGYQRLVNDFIGVGDLMDTGLPVCFDVTHSTQLPGAGAGVTAGRPERASLLLRAAVAAGVDAIFLECHPDPRNARSDGATQQPLHAVPDLLKEAAAIRSALMTLQADSSVR